MRNPLYFIGDVHGRRDLLDLVIQYAECDAGERGRKPIFMFLGDIVDRGPDSKGSMEAVHAALRKYPGSVLHLGNHDAWFLDALETRGKGPHAGDWAAQGGIDTVESYTPGRFDYDCLDEIKELYPHHVDMLRRAKLHTAHGSLVAVHAGLDPTLSPQEQGEETCCWIREPFLDYVDPSFGPVIHGHTIMEGGRPVVTENRISIDTGAYWSGRLTACLVDADRAELSFFQTDGHDQVVDVVPALYDRGHGTVMDRIPAIVRSISAAARTRGPMRPPPPPRPTAAAPSLS